MLAGLVVKSPVQAHPTWQTTNDSGKMVCVCGSGGGEALTVVTLLLIVDPLPTC